MKKTGKSVAPILKRKLYKLQNVNLSRTHQKTKVTWQPKSLKYKKSQAPLSKDRYKHCVLRQVPGFIQLVRRSHLKM